MEWKIPEPLSIRPCQKPSQFKARQLNQYPVKLKKLPQWVDKANFQVMNQQLEEKQKFFINSKESQIQNEVSYSLMNKYKNKDQYTLLYDRGQENYNYNQNFSYEYIPGNYKDLQNIEIQPKGKSKIDLEAGFSKKQLQFDSKFQCGNLSKAYQGNYLVIKVKNDNQYHLLMQNDINTLGYNQWFAFSINNFCEQGKNIDLRIVNFVINLIRQVKQNSLYKKGMKPWFIKEGSSSWKQIKSNCTYKKTNTRSVYGDSFYELNFQIYLSLGLTFIAMMPIYSYTRLCSNIKKWQSIKGMRIYQRKVYSLMNNIVPILEYIPHADEENEMNQEQIKWSDTIVIFARTHPGEVWSSFLIQEFIQTIVHYHKSNISKTRYLIFPMINPDGVIYGNFRCDFSGVDLNRVWIDPSRFTQCSIYQIKKILNKQFENKKAKIFIDFHSHSKKFNVFAYTSAQTLLQSRLVSDIIRLSDQNKIFDPVNAQLALNKEFLTESQTTFLSSKQIEHSNKKSTARAFMSRLTQRGKSMTIQISFYGYENKKSSENEIKQFSIRDFNDFSWSLSKKLHDVLNLKEEIILAKKILQNIYINHLTQSHENHNTNLNSLKKQQKPIEQQNDLSQDSDSEPQKYYTKETKKIIKSKNGDLYDCKLQWNSNNNKKGYLKSTESTVKKIQQFRKEKNKSNLECEQRKVKIFQTKNQKSLSITRQQIPKKVSTSTYTNKNKRTQRSDKDKLVNKQHENYEKIQSNHLLRDQPCILRKKIMMQSKKNEQRFLREKELQGQKSKDQCLVDKMIFLTNSAFEPVILQIDETKKYDPAFGQFLTKTKRTASRRYKTVTKEEYSIYKKELSKLDTNGLKPNFVKKIKIEDQIPILQEEKIFVDETTLPKTDFNTVQKLTKIQETEQQNFQGSNTKKKKQQLIRKNSKKNTGIDRINNFKNIYLCQRKKIIDMIKKETRLCNEVQKESAYVEDIQQIIQKRKRAKTEYDESKNYFDDRNILYNIKMGKVKTTKKTSEQQSNYSKRQASSRRQAKQNQFNERR